MSIIKLNNLLLKINNKLLTDSYSSTSVTDIDGNIYNAITLGTQTWTTSNLATTKYSDGTPILNLTGATAWATDTTGAYSWYNENISNKTSYGALYNWYAVTNIHGLAPAGYHIPTSTEWDTLVTFIGGGTLGGKLKSIGFTYWNSPNTNATDNYGFGLRGAGLKNSDGAYFALLKEAIYLWSTSSVSINGASKTMSSTTGVISTANISKQYGVSVRCVKN
jgi:uncharacterized protein (TIGR02145 family)